MSSTPQRIAIIGAMHEEIERLKNTLENHKVHQFGQVIIHTGQIAGKSIMLTLSGIGKVNAAIATTLVIEHFQPDCIINTGSAGGIGQGLKVGDVIVGTQIAHHDVDATAFGYVLGQVPQQPAHYDSDTNLLRIATRSARFFQNARIYQGMIVSGDSFIHSPEQVGRILKHFPEAQAVEMEAAAIAQTCHAFKLPFVIIRAISDSAQDKAEITFEEFLSLAAEHSAQMVLSMIGEISGTNT